MLCLPFEPTIGVVSVVMPYLSLSRDDVEFVELSELQGGESVILLHLITVSRKKLPILSLTQAKPKLNPWLLLQLSYVSGRTTGGARALEAAAAAHAMLVALGTDAAYGMLPSSDQEANAADQSQQRTGSRGMV